MMEYHIVVGANYGDEGKGLMTDYLVRKHGIKKVARFNGGCQAGHTVQTAEDRRIFSNWSSGTLAGAQTEFTSDVVLNPYHALKERETFKTSIPKILVPAFAITTTPFEIAINQAVEEMRGDRRHGSCGLGINETITRHTAMVNEGITDVRCARAMNWLMETWVPFRGKELGLSEDSIREITLKGPSYINAFLDMWYSAVYGQDAVYEIGRLWTKEDMVFEGAQGLALDEFIGVFPFVTRSNTGIGNALKNIRMRQAMHGSRAKVHIHYMTRAYNTRHGRGPLLGEMYASEVTCGRRFGEGRFRDDTNVPNPWQESLRFAPLDIYSMVERIRKDIERNKNLLSMIDYDFSVGITCMDQADEVMVFEGAFLQPKKIAVEKLPSIFQEMYGIKVSHVSYGPTAADVRTL